jgi:cell fate (sporulation/competence/biofilm development) regulator YlbF (YheA/YmcA/DUF963 family)
MATRLFVTGDDATKSMKIKNQAVLDMLDEKVRKYRTACNALGERLDDMKQMISAMENTMFSTLYRTMY